MEDTIKSALATDRLIDITTHGRKTGEARRKEVRCHYVDGKVYVTGKPGPRGWYANLLANPDFTFHLKQSVQRDIAARATPITDEARRRQVFAKMRAEAGGSMDYLDVEEWTVHSPLVEVELKLGR